MKPGDPAGTTGGAVAKVAPPATADRGRGKWTVRPRRASLLTLFRELWRELGLLPFLTLHLINQTFGKARLGPAWLIIRPALAVVIAVIVVGRVLGVETAPVPLLLFSTMSIALWMVFQRGFRIGTKSLLSNRTILARISFPRFMVLLAALGMTFVEFLVVFVAAIIMLVVFVLLGEFSPSYGFGVLLAPLALILMMMMVVGITSITSVLALLAFDVTYGLAYVISALLIISPVAYPLSAVPAEWQWVYDLNPMTAIFELWRAGTLAMPAPEWGIVALSVGMILLIDLIGISFFLYYERAVLDRT